MVGKFRIFCLSFALSVWPGSAISLGAQDLPTILELQREYVEAHGGFANIQDLKSIVASGEIVLQGEKFASFKLYRKRPSSLRVQIEGPRRTIKKIFDGAEGYQVTESADGQVDVEPITGERLEDLKSEATIDGPFFRLRSEADHLSVVGLAEVEGRPAYEISVDGQADSRLRRIWLDHEHFYEIKTLREIENPDGEIIRGETLMSDFDQVNGIWFARETRYFEDGELVQHLKIDSVRGNVGLFDSFFNKPR